MAISGKGDRTGRFVVMLLEYKKGPADARVSSKYVG